MFQHATHESEAARLATKAARFRKLEAGCAARGHTALALEFARQAFRLESKALTLLGYAVRAA